MLRLQANEGGGCGVGNRLLLKKHTLVMKEKEGVQAEKASVTQRNSRWVRGGRRERNVMGKKNSRPFFFHFVQLGKIPILPQSEH